MYLYQRSFNCSGSPGVVPHIIGELTDLAIELCDLNISLWRGVAGIADLEFRWTIWCGSIDHTRQALDMLRRDRRVMTLFEELLTAGWDGQSIDHIGAASGLTSPPAWRQGEFIEDRALSIIGSNVIAAHQWLERLATAGRIAPFSADVPVINRWASTSMCHLIRSAGRIDDFAEADARRQDDAQWREARRHAGRHFDLANSSATLWRRSR
jgi:hypothetical protein